MEYFAIIKNFRGKTEIIGAIVDVGPKLNSFEHSRLRDDKSLNQDEVALRYDHLVDIAIADLVRQVKVIWFELIPD